MTQDLQDGSRFPLLPAARASYKPGTVYAVDGGNRHVYFAQTTATLNLGFFRFRSLDQHGLEDALRSDVMCRIGVARYSITDALRAGRWLKLGRRPLHPNLAGSGVYVCWPLFSSRAEVCTVLEGARSGEVRETTIDDPDIQELEMAISWEANAYLVRRLNADFGDDVGEEYADGPVWRHRRRFLQRARLHPDDKFAAMRAREALLPSDH